MTKQKQPSRITPIIERLTVLQAESRLLSYKLNERRQFLTLTLLILGTLTISMFLYYARASWYIILLPVIVPLFTWLIFEGRSHPWTGLQGKTLWDWFSVVLIPILLAIYTFAMTLQQTSIMEQQNHIADEQMKSDILRDYTHIIQDLILDKGLLQSKPEENARITASTQTALTLEQLDQERKAQLLLFIYKFKLIDRSSSIINLYGANLYGANLTGASLHEANLEGANFGKANFRSASLYGANLEGAKLRSADLSNANLSGVDLRGSDLGNAILIGVDFSNANLSGVNLSGVDLSGVDLTSADLTSADLIGANLTGANLTGAKVTDGQLEQIRSLRGAIMPDGSKHP